MWVREAISNGEIDALRKAAERAWGNDTCHPLWVDYPRPSGGQCFVTACWLVSRLGGHVGKRAGHFAWLSPDGSYLLDITGGHTGTVIYGPNPGYEIIENAESERSRRFAKRADRIFSGLPKLADLAGADAYPGEEPERATMNAQDDGPYWHDEPQPAGEDDAGSATYRFVYANGQLEISPDHEFGDLAEHAGTDLDHTGPMATGYVTILNQQATWDVQANVNLRSLVRIFKDYCKHVGWRWGGMCDIEGQPISDEFAPKKSYTLEYVYAVSTEHLYLGRTTHSDLLLTSKVEGDWLAGRLQIREANGRVSAYVEGVHIPALPALYEWATDGGMVLYAANDNQLKRIPDLEVKDNYDPNPKPTEPKQDERSPSGLYTCPGCQRLFPSWDEYQKHRREEESWGDEQVENGGFPDVDMDATFPTHFTDQQPYTMPVASVREAARVDGFKGGNNRDRYYVTYQYGCPVAYARVREGKVLDAVAHGGTKPHLFAALQRFTGQDPSRLLPGPVPFIYDVKQDSVTVGEAGTRTADIPGKFTPGGIVEGMYEPGGKIVVKTMTNMPYTVNHMVSLWYWQHPELAVKSVYLQDEVGGTTKLAAGNVGTMVAAHAAADPTVHSAAQALMAAGGQVFAVGGAVRDAVLGQEPKDVDLMVTGLPADQVRQVLGSLPGHVKLTGQDFGVFRYRHGNSEVEVALPRREHSTGEGHKDFEVQADHTMKVEDDLQRRDFTVNSMAVNLANGELIDPHGGANDIGAGRLRTITDTSLSEDPLRVLRGLVAHARYGFTPDDVTRHQMQANAESLHNLSPERIQEELDKLFAAKDPASAIRLAHETGVLRHFLPEVDSTFGYSQNNQHHEMHLGDHVLNVLGRTATKTSDRDLRLAALLHDIGKPASAWQDPETGQNHYYLKILDDGTRLGANHEDVGADMTKQIMGRLRYPNDRTKRVSDIVQNHMYPKFTTPRGARKFLARVGPDLPDDLFTLRWADQGGKTFHPADPTSDVDRQRQLVEQVQAAGQPTTTGGLAINGNDLIAAGFEPGPQMGQVLNYLTEQVIENPELNNAGSLLNMARQYANVSGE